MCWMLISTADQHRRRQPFCVFFFRLFVPHNRKRRTHGTDTLGRIRWSPSISGVCVCVRPPIAHLSMTRGDKMTQGECDCRALKTPSQFILFRKIVRTKRPRLSKCDSQHLHHDKIYDDEFSTFSHPFRSTFSSWLHCFAASLHRKRQPHFYPLAFHFIFHGGSIQLWCLGGAGGIAHSSHPKPCYVTPNRSSS